MIRHTPGPWEAKGKSVRTVQHTAEGSAPNGYQGGICNCFGRRMGPRSTIDDVAEANARLIAASPDLLEALEAVLAHVEDEDAPRVGGQCTLCKTYRDLIRFAIDKAKG